MSIRLLLITGSYPPMKCGVGSYTQRLAKALTEYGGVRVSVLTDFRASDQPLVDGVDVVPIIRGWNVSDLFNIAKYIKKTNPNIIHIQYPTQGYSGRIPVLLPLLIRILGKPCVQTWHEPPLGLSKVLLVIGLKELITVRLNFLHDLPKLMQLAVKLTSFICIPAASILPAVVQSDNERLNLRKSYAGDKEFFLAYYGFVAPLKGIETLLEVVKKINARLLMVCDLESGNEYHQSLFDKIKEMGVGSNVTITGFLPEDQLAAILSASDAVVLPFRDGSARWNTSIDGAVAQGSFVVSTSTDIRGYNKEKNIYYSKPGDVEEIVLAIKLYSGCHVPCKSSESEWKDISDRHINVYKRLITS